MRTAQNKYMGQGGIRNAGPSLIIVRQTRSSSTVRSRKSGSLIPIMQDIQAEYRYLPGELLNLCSRTDRSHREQKLTASLPFYENFSFEAKGKYVIKVCDGTACHVRKSHAGVGSTYGKNLGLSRKEAHD